MVTTRSSRKRKSAEGAEPEGEEHVALPATRPKRQRLPVRRKGAAEQDNGEDDRPNIGNAPAIADGNEEDAAGEGNEEVEDQAQEVAANEAAEATGLPTVIKFDDDIPVGDDMPAESLAHTEEAKKPSEDAPQPAKEEIAGSEDQGESDDEAPEAISNVQAATVAKEAAQVTQKAAKDEAQRLKRKRQERDALFREQAKTRKEAEEKAKEAVAQAEAEEEALQPRTKRTRGKRDIPTLLPVKFLDSDDEDAYQGDLSSVGEPQQKRKRGGRQRRERLVGRTLFKVVEQTDTRAPPKREKWSEKLRVSMLRKGRVPVKQNKGFFANRK